MDKLDLVIQEQPQAIMMREQPPLPPIQLLLGFEAAARTLSFKQAAEELNVTASAISQKIKHLEDWLGIQLFQRFTRSLALTDAGREYQRLAQDVLAFYQQRHREFCRRHTRRYLRVSMMPFIAHELVIPALHTFQERHPEVELRIEASAALVNFAEDDVDAAIRFGLGDWPGLRSRILCKSSATLVCSPELLKAAPIRDAGDLGRHQLISVRGAENYWDLAAQVLGLPEIRSRRVLGLDDYLGAMIAARQGLGIALSSLPVTNAWLTDGRLVQPLPIQVEIPQGYYFVQREADGQDPRLECLFEWLAGLFQAL